MNDSQHTAPSAAAAAVQPEDITLEDSVSPSQLVNYSCSEESPFCDIEEDLFRQCSPVPAPFDATELEKLRRVADKKPFLETLSLHSEYYKGTTLAQQLASSSSSLDSWAKVKQVFCNDLSKMWTSLNEFAHPSGSSYAVISSYQVSDAQYIMQRVSDVGLRGMVLCSVFKLPTSSKTPQGQLIFNAETAMKLSVREYIIVFYTPPAPVPKPATLQARTAQVFRDILLPASQPSSPLHRHDTNSLADGDWYKIKRVVEVSVQQQLQNDFSTYWDDVKNDPEWLLRLCGIPDPDKQRPATPSVPITKQIGNPRFWEKIVELFPNEPEKRFTALLNYEEFKTQNGLAEQDPELLPDESTDASNTHVLVFYLKRALFAFWKGLPLRSGDSGQPVVPRSFALDIAGDPRIPCRAELDSLHYHNAFVGPEVTAYAAMILSGDAFEVEEWNRFFHFMLMERREMAATGKTKDQQKAWHDQLMWETVYGSGIVAGKCEECSTKDITKQTTSTWDRAHIAPSKWGVMDDKHWWNTIPLCYGCNRGQGGKQAKVSDAIHDPEDSSHLFLHWAKHNKFQSIRKVSLNIFRKILAMPTERAHVRHIPITKWTLLSFTLGFFTILSMTPVEAALRRGWEVLFLSDTEVDELTKLRFS